MPVTQNHLYDVVIGGGGPVGLFLACELRLAGCSVLVLEREEAPDSPLKRLPFGLRGLSVPTIESLDRRDLLSALDTRAVAATPAAAHWAQQPRRPAGHFAGIQVFHDRVDAACRDDRPPGPAGMLAADLAGIEAVLAARAAASGVEIRRGAEVRGFQQSEAEVAVLAGGETVRGRWLVGCDGGRSRVRKAAGIGFEGTEPEFTGTSADVVLADPAGLPPGRHHTAAGLVIYTPPGLLRIVDFDGGASHRTVPLTCEHVESLLRRVSGIDVGLAALGLATTWTDRACQATAYRRGRVLLAGDAAHVHSPLGGQGLNLGLGDAMNLGWKLGATIRGEAPDGLLDSYAAERQPVGARVLDWSRAQVALMRPGRGSRALEAVMRDLLETRDGATYVAERVWGLGLSYDLGGRHPLVGRSAPDIVLRDGTRLNHHLRDGRSLLVDFDPRAPLRSLADRWGDRIGYRAADAGERPGVEALLVRPDGVVAWADGAAGGAAEADRALSRILVPQADASIRPRGPDPSIAT